MNYHALQFLRGKGLIDGDKTEFIISFEDGRKFELSEILKEYEKKTHDYSEDLREKLTQGRDYLMQVPQNDITVEDTLEAFGFGRNGLQHY